jgi:hypothetical protein
MWNYVFMRKALAVTSFADILHIGASCTSHSLIEAHAYLRNGIMTLKMGVILNMVASRSIPFLT